MSDVDRIKEIDRIVASASNAHVADENGFTGWSRGSLIALAQVHATVALADAQEKLTKRIPVTSGGDLAVSVVGEVSTR